MKALLLAAGFGTRLGEITKKTPKCLVRVGQGTMLDHWLYKLVTLGVNEFFVNTHYLSNQVEEFIANHPLKKKVTILHEPKLLGTGGTIACNIEILEGETCRYPETAAYQPSNGIDHQDEQRQGCRPEYKSLDREKGGRNSPLASSPLQNRHHGYQPEVTPRM